MRLSYKTLTNALSIVLSFLLFIGFYWSAGAKTNQSFNYYESIEENNLDSMSNEQQVVHLTKMVKYRDRLLTTLTKKIQENDQYENINDILSDFTIKILADNISNRISNLINNKEKKLKINISEEAKLASSLSSTNIEPSKNSFASLEEDIESMVEGYIYDKENVPDINYLYKISHDIEIVETIGDSFNYTNNVQLLGRKWADENLSAEYEEIAEDMSKYDPDKEIVEYVRCISLTNQLCHESIGKAKLVKNVSIYLNKKKQEEKIRKFTEQLENANEEFMHKSKKLSVTSYNPECKQTKGGVMGEDGNCYATPQIPCAIGRNKGKTEGLCGNPYIAATGHNLKDMMADGIRPMAVTQNLQYLKGKDVFLKCTNKKGELIYDDRCNGYFTIYDYKHERFEDSVDLFFENREDNIGGVFVEIYYN